MLSKSFNKEFFESIYRMNECGSSGCGGGICGNFVGRCGANQDVCGHLNGRDYNFRVGDEVTIVTYDGEKRVVNGTIL